MSDDSLQARSRKWQPDAAKITIEEYRLQEESDAERHTENRKRDDATPEWRRFYEVVREITQDMRDE